MFQFFACFYWLVAYYFGGPHWRCLLIHFLSDGLRPIRSCHFYWSLPGCRCDFSYWHGIALLLVNPVVFVNYGQIGALLLAFIHSCFLIAYLIMATWTASAAIHTLVYASPYVYSDLSHRMLWVAGGNCLSNNHCDRYRGTRL